MKVILKTRCVAPQPTIFTLRDVIVDSQNENLDFIATSWLPEQPPQQLSSGMEITSMVVFRAKGACKNESAGRVRILWSRADDEGDSSISAPTSEFVCILPSFDVEISNIVVDFAPPTQGRMGEPLEISIRVTNSSEAPRSIRISIVENDPFLVCGFKLLDVLLLPKLAHVSTFSLIPVKVGASTLPSLKVRSISSEEYLFDSSDRYSVIIAPGACIEQSAARPAQSI